MKLLGLQLPEFREFMPHVLGVFVYPAAELKAGACRIKSVGWEESHELLKSLQRHGLFLCYFSITKQ